MMLFLKPLLNTGRLPLDGVTPEEMIKASDAAFHHDYEPMEAIIAKSIKKK